MFFKKNKNRNILISLITAFLLFCITFFAALFFAVPKIINSNYFIQNVQKIIYDKTKLNIEITKSNFTLSKKLSANLKIERIEVKNIICAKNILINADIKTLSIKNATFDYVFIDVDKLKEIQNKKTKNKKSKFKLSKISKLDVKNIDIVFQGINLKVRDFKYSTKNTSYNLYAEDISVNYLMKLLLKYQKSKDSSKKFIENFKDFNGKIGFNLKYENNNLSGFIKADKLSAVYSAINIPLYFESAVFDIKNNNLTSYADGLIGTNKVIHTLEITNILSKEREVFGKLNSSLDEKISKKYLKNEISILKTIDVTLKYHIKDKIPTVEYYINLDKGSDIFYKNAYLGCRNKKRFIFAKTIKDCKNLHLKQYSYSMIQNNKINKIIEGDGLFVSEKGKLTPGYITCHTNGYAPVSVTGFFGRYLDEGEFKGSLKYDFTKKLITGNFEVINTIFNDFYVEKASVKADEKTGIIRAYGKYKKQDFSCFAKIKNKFDDTIYVYNMDLFLDKYIFKANKKKKAKNHNKSEFNKADFSKKMRKIDMTIKNWSIKVNEITFDKIFVQDINLFGKLENSIFEFYVPRLNYAKGLLKANGRYNFIDDSSNICFNVQNIDSNFIADKIFNLPNQIQGTANASLKIETLNNLETLKAKSNFEIQDGFLPQLGNFEFMFKKFKNGRKIRISDLTNADLTKAKSFNSDIKGSFELNNYKLENINLTTKQKSLSLFIEGNYHIKKQDACIDMYGKYDLEAPKGVKILFVPLNWILNFAFRTNDDKSAYISKINKIPSIDSKTNKVKLFKINLKGNINSGDIKVDIKGLK